MRIHKEDITAVILAGGQGRRMGGQDKGLLEFDGRLMIEILIEQLQNQQLDILINANRNQVTYRSYGYPVIGDDLEDYQGPLAGFASAMATVKTRYILTLPCDSPRIADSFVERFVETQDREKSPVCVAHDGERLQPVYALIETRLLDDLKQFLDSGERKIDRWYALHNYARVDFSDDAAMFQNINTPEDQQRMQQASHK
ncbi:MAG: molybdenum cofactor guanylyltransferase [Gammaproteobacteria bacterium]|nr:molybdenum cofactor guanylyltransferase [Gammaproteobacteria bacterium]